jgi:hypothetical protein
MAKKKQIDAGGTVIVASSEKATSTDGLWVLYFPAGQVELRDQCAKLLEEITTKGPSGVTIPDSCKLTRIGDNSPHFTWDQQTPPLTRERRDDDPPYPAMRVINSLTPVTKMGRAIRPLTAIDAEYAVWEVEIEGVMREVRNPEEAWR